MTYQILLNPKAAKFLSRLSETLRTQIKDALRELQGSPETKGERLAAPTFWRVGVGDYRAVSEIDRKNRKMIVLYVGHRSMVYDGFTRLLWGGNAPPRPQTLM